MNSSQVRKKFLDFFKGKNHTIVPSDSLIPANDPTLLFTGAGMNQFKDYFLGVKKDLKRAASAQKCFRTGDVEQVGKTQAHLTFFEMLGNFSFGDYFKGEAIAYAWEFLTKEMGLSEDRLWVTVYEEDDEAAGIWEKKIKLPRERIIRLGAKDNFWPSNAPADGPNGPCGPCSEIYFDYERSFIGKICPDEKRCNPVCSCGRFIEIWNLVFTQFDRQEGGKLVPLPMKNIDTGMGFERMVAVTQNKMTVFETDLFEPILEVLVQLLRQEAADQVKLDQRASVYAIADHLRALTFLIGDGVVPSNEGRGYVLRMLLRKAKRAGMSLGLKKPFLYTLVPIVTKVMESGYPELVGRRESIAKAILSEEERFQQTLQEKLPLLEEMIQGAKKSGHFSAYEAAKFYDTHGLSYDEISEVAKTQQMIPPSRKEFDQALGELQAKSKAASSFSGEIWTKDQLQELVIQVAASTRFLGYSDLTASGKVLGLIQGNRLVKEVKAIASVGVILDQTPFYGESGGQVGDVGIFIGSQGKLKVADTQRVGRVLFHHGELLEGKIQVGDSMETQVDPSRRRKVAQNHTATHLLHSALRKVLGDHVVQAGSLVAPDHLRFDFSHAQALSSPQRKSVEELVNEWIESSLRVLVQELSLEEARRSGALALFGEKYESQVRVVSIGSVSKELCGGTHLEASSEVGLLTIVEEGSVAAGIRRIEALSGSQARTYLSRENERLEGLLLEEKEKSKKIEKLHQNEISRRSQKEALERTKDLSGVKLGAITFFAQELKEPLNHTGLRSYADAIRKADPEAVIFLSDSDGFCVATSGPTALKQGIQANQILRLATEVAGGSGGGRPEMAQGRLKEVSRFSEIQKRLEAYIKGAS